MITLLYRAETVGPVCRRVCKVEEAEDNLDFLRDDEPIPDPEGKIIRWGSVKDAVNPCINTAAAVAVAKDKVETRKVLGNLAPPTWFRRQDIPKGMPVVVRPRNHHAGLRFYVCRTEQQIDRAIRRCRTWYASLLVEKAREFRVFVCQGYVVAVSERFPADASAIAWNLAMGGRLINVRYKEWSIPVVKTSILAAKKLGLDWAAIDVTIDTGGDVFVFEANTAPGLRNPHTIGQIARVFSWIDDNDTPPETEGKTWRTLLHPALR